MGFCSGSHGIPRLFHSVLVLYYLCTQPRFYRYTHSSSLGSLEVEGTFKGGGERKCANLKG
uniref:Uncharacterized protein n=1 Tax=Arundo donax TaxID=35708 RepID=A0A0A9H3G1_ARUDO